MFSFKTVYYYIMSGKKRRQKPRNIYCVSDLDPALVRRIKLYAIAKRMLICEAFSSLLWRGLAAENDFSNEKDKKVNLFIAETEIGS